jgi:hypothetical protein
VLGAPLWLFWFLVEWARPRWRLAGLVIDVVLRRAWEEGKDR